MKNILLACCLLTSVALQSQVIADSILRKYDAAELPAEKLKALGIYFSQVARGRGDIAEKINNIIGARDFFALKHDEVGKDYCTFVIANYYRVNGDHELALKTILPLLGKFEGRKDSTGIIRSLTVIGSCFTNSDNIEQGLLYNKQCYPIAKAYGNSLLYAGLLNNLGDCYNKLNQPDSALPYMQ